MAPVRGIIWYCWSQAGGGPLGVGIDIEPGKFVREMKAGEVQVWRW